jgi:integrase
MPYLSPPTLTRSEQETLLRVSSEHPRDHLIFSLALGTGLRLPEIVGLNVGDVFTIEGKPRSRLRHRQANPSISPNFARTSIAIRGAPAPRLLQRSEAGAANSVASAEGSPVHHLL